jgi:glutamate synthase domain-containing protein 3
MEHKVFEDTILVDFEGSAGQSFGALRQMVYHSRFMETVMTT